MNKFAFQNNARQSHLPASLTATSSHSCRASPSVRLYSAGQAAPPFPVLLSSSPPPPPSYATPSPSRRAMRRGTRSLFLACSFAVALTLSFLQHRHPRNPTHNPTFFIPSYQLIRF